MGNVEFETLSRKAVADWYSQNREEITTDDVYVVWVCKTLQNNKALLATTKLDNMYFEVTYNGDKGEMYLDAYSKVENMAIKVQEVN
ncbi:MAG: hypothetical protein J6A19_05210 [Oscillospiraceae bacterium]|nr:hypothetical protein [Oscillospiraceae bacterium]